MKILVINSGSSSLKYALYELSNKSLVHKGEVLSFDEGSYRHIYNDEKIDISKSQWEQRIDYLLNFLREKEFVQEVSDIAFAIHRIVHGGLKYVEPILITELVLNEMNSNIRELAPLHNPYALDIVHDCLNKLTSSKQIGVFDTAFGATIPEENYLYALPLELSTELGLRRFAFHGISHRYVSKTYRNRIGSEQQNTSNPNPKSKLNKGTKIVSLHLGSGSSACAINNLQCVDTSFGFSPEENIVMATRVGEIDYSAVEYLKNKKHYSDNDITQLLNYKCGLLGVTGYTKDMKTILEDMTSNKRAKLAYDLFINSIVKQTAEMIMSLNGIDVLIFTGGIGQGSDIVRKSICDRLSIFGVYIDVDTNVGKQDLNYNLNITGKDSKVEIWVIPTDEEHEMLNESDNLLVTGV